MRKLLTATAMILAMGAATPALADGYNGHGNNGNFGNHNGPAPQQQPAYEHTERFDRDVNAWERNWTPFRIDIRFGNHTLSRWQIERRLEAQGYYRVHDLTQARFGSWRAVAMYRGHRVILRVDQYSGRVLAARYI